MIQRARMSTAGHQTRKMRHIDHEERTDLIGDFAESLEIENTGIGRAACQHELGPMFTGERRNNVHVDKLVFAANAVGNGLEPFSRLIDRRAVRGMAASIQTQSHEGVAGLKQRKEHRLVGLRTRMRLHIGVISAE